MLIGIIGESCTGKSTLASKLAEMTPFEVFAGKDYLRLAKNENIAETLFRKKLSAAVSGNNIIYVITEKEHLALLPDGAVRVLVTADLETIKARFADRMRGVLPPPVSAMLERKHGCFDHEANDVHVVSEESDLDAVCMEILRRGSEKR